MNLSNLKKLERMYMDDSYKYYHHIFTKNIIFFKFYNIYGVIFTKKIIFFKLMTYYYDLNV